MISGTVLLTALASVLFRPCRTNNSNQSAIPVVRQAPLPTFSDTAIWPIQQVPQRTLTFPPVGALNLYGNMTTPAIVALFISGDGGWNAGVTNMAKAVAQDGQTLVVGIDIAEYFKKLQAKTSECLYPAADMEALSEFVQRTLQLPIYLKPVLVGHSSGASLAYALLCQAPLGTFRGGIALGFCPDIEISKPLCAGSGKLTMTRSKNGKYFDFTNQPSPGAPLELLHGEMDQDCNCQKTCNFFQDVKLVNTVRLPKVGHGFAVVRNWLPQFKQAMQQIYTMTDRNTGMLLPAFGGPNPVASTTNLPLAVTQAVTDMSKPMVLFISGDGGWTGMDQQICDHLAAKNVPTVGLNSQSYFWNKKTPEQTVADLEPVIRNYLSAWGKTKFILAGYSFGANIAPFIVNRLSIDLKGKLDHLVLLSSDPKGDFEIHVAGMLGSGGGPYDVATELRNMRDAPVLCVSGEKEDDLMQKALRGVQGVQFEKLPGSHSYNGDAEKIAKVILKDL